METTFSGENPPTGGKGVEIGPQPLLSHLNQIVRERKTVKGLLLKKPRRYMCVWWSLPLAQPPPGESSLKRARPGPHRVSVAKGRPSNLEKNKNPWRKKTT